MLPLLATARRSLPSFKARVSEAWSGKRDSNPRPLPWQGNALPIELFPRIFTSNTDKEVTLRSGFCQISLNVMPKY